LLLALVFAVAGAAKLSDRVGSRQDIVDFGLPSSLATPLGILLPLAELAVAVALIPPATAPWGALGALALLVLFVAGISYNLARGHQPDCHCFGQLHSAPAGWKTLARNVVLAALAGFVLWQGWEDAGPSAFAWLMSLTAAGLLGLIAGLVVLGILAVQWLVLVNLFRQNGRLLVRLDAVEERLDLSVPAAIPSEDQPEEQRRGLPPGSPAPTFSLPGLYGETHTLDSLRTPDKPVVLLFTDPDCGPCTALLPKIGRWQRDHPDALTISLISRGTPKENHAKMAEHGVERVLLQEDWEIAETYGVSSTPSAALVTSDGAIAGFLTEGPEEISTLVERLAEGQIPCPDCGTFHDTTPGGKEIGEPAPELELPNLCGGSIELADFKGSETLVLFWSPDCVFCKQMLDDLKEWEANPPKGAPGLLVVSEGAVAANKAMGLASPVVLDEGFSIGHAFGASGTPSAVLVDPDGNVASEVVVGAPEVLALAGTRQARA
jgi:peroxiredoxin